MNNQYTPNKSNRKSENAYEFKISESANKNKNNSSNKKIIFEEKPIKDFFDIIDIEKESDLIDDLLPNM